MSQTSWGVVRWCKFVACGLIVLAGILFGTTMYFEAALLFAMVGFVSTVALCKFLLRGNVIE